MEGQPVIVRDLWRLSHPDAPMAASVGTKAQCEEWRDRNPVGRALESYIIEPHPHCGCCGATFVPSPGNSLTTWTNGATRCGKHHGRNPCAIEGCTRTRAAPLSTGGFPYHADDQCLCGDHWRRYVPPRSRARRAYHAHFRRAKRQGWTAKNERAFWRYWASLVAMARRRASGGHLDEAEINRLMGWDDGN